MGLLDDAVSAGQDAVDAGVSAGQEAAEPSNVVGAVPVVGPALSSVATAGETAGSDYENPIGDILNDAGEDVYSGVNYWGAGGLLPGPSDATGGGLGSTIPDAVDDALNGGGDGNGNNDNGNDDPSGSGLPSWLLPAAVVAAAGAYLVFGGEI